MKLSFYEPRLRSYMHDGALACIPLDPVLQNLLRKRRMLRRLQHKHARPMQSPTKHAESATLSLLLQRKCETDSQLIDANICKQ